MQLVSLVDQRHDIADTDLRHLLKFYLYHIELYGPHSCCLEADGVEIDPLDYITSESYNRALGKHKKQEQLRATWER